MPNDRAGRRLPCAAFVLAAALAPAGAIAAPCPVALPVSGEYSSGFGQRGRVFHAGVDLRAPTGTPVRAAVGGTVAFAGRYYAYGIILDIRHADGSVARYAHLSRIAPGLTPGAAVAGGETIGAVGRTGRTTGAHLHIELRRDGRPVDPWPWLARTACRSDVEVAEAQR
ncbi:M23 family metallopeptidase [Roseomonas sp. HF4]|uniref:M23 family metallopeptidase n=1 Tax=Roseomonas sp. HF4 TaxID=2562313 RepID=UPI0010C10D2C|nr:M23 family metallopeptidase [Roseomonas sp. HF4]